MSALLKLDAAKLGALTALDAEKLKALAQIPAADLEAKLKTLSQMDEGSAAAMTALGKRIAWGASPRGSIALERCARARAWLQGRDFVTPEDVRAIAPDVLRHRVLPSYEATAEGWDGDRLVAELLQRVPLP